MSKSTSGFGPSLGGNLEHRTREEKLSSHDLTSVAAPVPTVSYCIGRVVAADIKGHRTTQNHDCSKNQRHRSAVA